MKLKVIALAVVLSALMGQFAVATAQTRVEASIESLVPREGLQFYFEISSSGFGELSRSADAMLTLNRMLSVGPLKVSSSDLAAFIMANAAALANTRLALIGYADSQTAVALEAASESGAAQLTAPIARLFDSNQTRGIGTAAFGRIVVAGSPALLARLRNANSEGTLADDQEFVKARSRFSSDSLFAYMRLNARSLGLPGGDLTGLAQTPAALAVLSGVPYAIALGGSLHGDSATVQALLLNATPRSADRPAGVLGGLLTSASSSAIPGQPRAASFANANADVFVDVRIDWEKLLDSLQMLFGAFTEAAAARANGSQSGGETVGVGDQRVDLFGMMEASLGFSIRHDLIPTLGNEIAFTLSDLADAGNIPARGVGASGAQTAGIKAGKRSPRFVLMLALRDEVKFEKLLGKLINGVKGTAPRPLAQSVYRGATIKSGKDIAYTITNGFFLAGGSPAEIRRVLDAQALGNSLDSTPEFREAMTTSRQPALQAFLSSRLSKELLDSLRKDAAKSGSLPSPSILSEQSPVAIGLSLTPDDDGLLIEANLPTSVLTVALAAMLNAKPLPYGITSAPGKGRANSGTAQPGSHATPRLTDDDLRFRRP